MINDAEGDDVDNWFHDNDVDNGVYNGVDRIMTTTSTTTMMMIIPIINNPGTGDKVDDTGQ